MFLSFSRSFAKVENVFWDKVIQFIILCLGCPSELTEDIQQIFISGEDQLIKHVEFCDTDIDHKGLGVSYQMVW